ncbi:MAG: hypothetical protein ACLTBR_02895 [Anaerostipes sp.]|uniref:hypothetical protein n=1 Tax=Anaerostipes sp. TaxID=1872530 RepID=UPI003992CD0C
MEKLTREEAIELHRKMWNWIADETEKTGRFIQKDDYFLATHNIPAHFCYCCEYAIQQNNGEFIGRCKYCPLDWRNRLNEYMCQNNVTVRDHQGLYGRWTFEKDIQERSRLARQIANLPNTQRYNSRIY